MFSQKEGGRELLNLQDYVWSVHPIHPARSLRRYGHLEQPFLWRLILTCTTIEIVNAISGSAIL